MDFLGQEYKLEKQENFEELLDSLGAALPAEFKSKLLEHKPTTKLGKSGNTYTLYTGKGDGTYAELNFEDGKQFDETVYAKAAKSTINVDGNNVTQVQKFDNGTSITIKREFSKDAIVSTITNSDWDGVARRYYKA